MFDCNHNNRSTSAGTKKLSFFPEIKKIAEIADYKSGATENGIANLANSFMLCSFQNMNRLN